MRRAADRTDRPLLPLVVSGPSGSGKTSGVAEAARINGVRVVSEGSDDTQTDAPERGSFVGVKSFAAWKQALSTRSFTPQILVIDDADAFLGQNGEKSDAFLSMTRCATPVVVIANDLYASPILRDLKGKNCISVQARPILARQMQMLLGREFPSASPESIKAIVLLRPGDVRGARLDLKSGANRPADNLVCVSQASSIFDIVHASLGIDGRLPRDQEMAEAIVAEHADAVDQLIANHYVSAVLGMSDALPRTAALADAFSAADGWSDISEHLRIRRIPAAIREARIQGDVSLPKRLDFRGPFGGIGSKESAAAEKTWEPVAEAVQLLDIQRRTPIVCETFDGKHHPTVIRPIAGLWQRRDELAFLAQKHGKLPKQQQTQLLTAKDAKAAVQAETNEAAEHPWQARKKPKIV